jgi:integrating conjugative element protein (TIGR03755 family)
MKAGYNILNSRPVNDNSQVSDSACTGGLCRTWKSPDQAAQFMQRVVGDQKIRTCENCQTSESTAGVGLTPILQEEQEKIAKVLTEMVTNKRPTSPQNLEEASGGSMRVTRHLVEALRQDPDQALLLERLSGELALVRVLEQSIWASRALLAGMHEPNIANVKEAGNANERSLENLDREINLIKTELEVRQALASNTAVATLDKMLGRRGDASPLDPIDPEADRVGDADKARSVKQ